MSWGWKGQPEPALHPVLTPVPQHRGQRLLFGSYNGKTPPSRRTLSRGTGEGTVSHQAPKGRFDRSLKLQIHNFTSNYSTTTDEHFGLISKVSLGSTFVPTEKAVGETSLSFWH